MRVVIVVQSSWMVAHIRRIFEVGKLELDFLGNLGSEFDVDNFEADFVTGKLEMDLDAGALETNLDADNLDFDAGNYEANLLCNFELDFDVDNLDFDADNLEFDAGNSEPDFLCNSEPDFADQIEDGNHDESGKDAVCNLNENLGNFEARNLNENFGNFEVGKLVADLNIDCFGSWKLDDCSRIRSDNFECKSASASSTVHSETNKKDGGKFGTTVSELNIVHPDQNTLHFVGDQEPDYCNLLPDVDMKAVVGADYGFAFVEMAGKRWASIAVY
jgi:hypothetical protein